MSSSLGMSCSRPRALRCGQGRRATRRTVASPGRSAGVPRRDEDPAVFHVRVAKPDEREPRFLAWEEADEVRSWMPEHVNRIVPIAILTMLRRTELLGIRDSDIDFEHGAMIVSQTQAGRRTRTKTSAGRRTVDLGPAALKLLREQQLARVPNPDGSSFPLAPAPRTRLTTS